MANFVKNVLLEARLPTAEFRRFRGKINIQRPRQPHYERARVIAVTTPTYKPDPVNKNCFQKPKYTQLTKIENPYTDIIAREVRNWFEKSKMIAIFHENSITSDDYFKARVAFHRENMQLKTYGLAIITKALRDTRFEATLPLLCSHYSIVFSPEQDVAKLLRIIRKTPQLILIGGILENKLMSKNEFTEFANMPNLQMAQAQLISVLNSAAGQIVNSLESHQKCLVNILDVHAKSASDEIGEASNSPKPHETSSESK